MNNVKFTVRIKYESEKAAEEMKKALTQLRSLPIHEIGVAGTEGAEGSIGAGGAVGASGAGRDGGAGGAKGGIGAVGTGRAVGAGRLDAAIESTVDRFRPLFQWIE